MRGLEAACERLKATQRCRLRISVTPECRSLSGTRRKSFRCRSGFLAAALDRVRHAGDMGTVANQISQPGWTGNLGALRIVKAVQRAPSSVDPIGRRSSAESSRDASFSSWSSRLRFSSPVSVGLRTIETGAAILAQCQSPWTSRRFSVDAKVQNAPLRHRHRIRCRRPRPIRDRYHIDRPGTPCWGARGSSDPSVLLSEIGSREIERERPSAAGASTGLILSELKDHRGHTAGGLAGYAGGET